MAIARGAGTEIIRTAMFEDIGNNSQKAIIGVQHHIYTVLSVVVHATAVGPLPYNYVYMWIEGHDSGPNYAAGQVINIFRQDMNQHETFVWNDKFSFNGAEPTTLTSRLSIAAEQDAISDQASGTAQLLFINGGNSNNQFDITVTFIDQNNA